MSNLPSRPHAELADLLLPAPGSAQANPLRLRQVTVTATATTPNTVTVQIGGSSTSVAGVRYLASYTPAVNDVAFAIQNGPDLLVLGRIA